MKTISTQVPVLAEERGGGLLALPVHLIHIHNHAGVGGGG